METTTKREMKRKEKDGDGHEDGTDNERSIRAEAPDEHREYKNKRGQPQPQQNNPTNRTKQNRATQTTGHS